MDRNKKILGRPQVSSQWTVVQSGKRRLRGSGIEGETSAEAGNSLEATDLHGIILSTSFSGLHNSLSTSQTHTSR